MNRRGLYFVILTLIIVVILSRSSQAKKTRYFHREIFEKYLKQSNKFKTTKGLIAEILSRPFIGGYQIGYSNRITNGMSGGPMLNYYGELIGINGMGQEPLFGNPYIFKDGSTISEAEWNKFSRLSWAVPIEIVQKLL